MQIRSKRSQNSTKTIPKSSSTLSPRRHKRRQIRRADAHQTSHAAGWQRATCDQTAHRFGRNRKLNGHSRNRQNRRQRCVGRYKAAVTPFSLRHGQALPPLIAPQPSAVLASVPTPAPVPPKPHEPHPPHQPKLRVGGGPLRQWGARVGSCEARYATPKNRAGVNPVTGLPTSSSLVAAWAGSNRSEGYGQPSLPRLSTGKP